MRMEHKIAHQIDFARCSFDFVFPYFVHILRFDFYRRSNGVHSIMMATLFPMDAVEPTAATETQLSSRQDCDAGDCFRAARGGGNAKKANIEFN